MEVEVSEVFNRAETLDGPCVAAPIECERDDDRMHPVPAVVKDEDSDCIPMEDVTAKSDDPSANFLLLCIISDIFSLIPYLSVVSV